MEIGVGLPTNLEDLSTHDVLDWARRADHLGFSSLAATDRLTSLTWEPVVALGAAAAVTSRVRLLSNVIVVPNRGSAGLLAKQLMTIDQVAEGRLVVGVGVGDREDDYRLAGQSMDGRHGRLDSMLDEISMIWSGSDPESAKIGPRFSSGGPPLLVGGRSPSTFRRAAERGIGWTVAISSPEQVRMGTAALGEAWADAGRPGKPRVVALTYFGLGPAAAAVTPRYLRDYYEFLGPIADIVATTAPTDEPGVQAAIAAYAEAGADELVFIPTIADGDQLDLLAGVTEEHVSARAHERITHARSTAHAESAH